MCPCPVRPRALLGVSLAFLCLAVPGRAQSGGPITLERWTAPARLDPNPGPGTDTFRLIAEAAWGPGAIKAPGRYAFSMRTPDGRSYQHPMLPRESTGSSRFEIHVPVEAVRDQRPERVEVRVQVIDLTTGLPVSNDLVARIGDFPSPPSGNPPIDPGPFGWGEPLPADAPSELPSPGPDGLRFVRLPSAEDASADPNGPVAFLAASEASNRQVATRLEGYTPPGERSDEFPLEGDDQPAFGLTPQRALDYCRALSAADPNGPAFVLPTRTDWLRAARAGVDTPFWWGEEPTHPEGANFLGPEPALAIDATAPTRPGNERPAFAANPWGLFHTFGNIAEWARRGEADDPSSTGFVRLGGHFRTEPAVPLEEPGVDSPDDLGGDLFVGVRPAFTLDAATGSEKLRTLLQADEALKNVPIDVRYDPRKATATVTGTVEDSRLRRRADERLRAAWWVAAVDNQLAVATVAAGLLAEIGQPAGPASRSRVIDVILDTLPVAVRWADTLPVEGSEWWVNLYTPTGGHLAYKLDPGEVGRDRTVPIHLDRRGLQRLGALPGGVVQVGLSLGRPAPSPGDPRLVSNLATLPLPDRP